MQAVGHLRQLGQKKIVKIYKYHVENSFNTKQLENNLNKSVPGLVAELNSKVFLMSFKEDTKEIDLGYWKQNSDGSLSQIPPDQVEHVSKEDLVESDDLIYALLDAMKAGALLTMHS